MLCTFETFLKIEMIHFKLYEIAMPMLEYVYMSLVKIISCFITITSFFVFLKNKEAHQDLIG